MAAMTRLTLEDHAFEELRSWIVSGKLAPGERLVETELADRLGLSRTSTRNAMARLSRSGLIVQEKFKSWSVVQLSSTDAWELWSLRSSLETLAAGIAAQRITEEGAQGLRAALYRLRHFEEEGHPNGAADLDFMIHREIVNMANHKRLRAAYDDIEAQTRIMVGTSNALAPQPLSLHEQHAPLVDAICAGNSDLARSLASSHADEDGARLIEQLREREHHDGSMDIKAFGPK